MTLRFDTIINNALNLTYTKSSAKPYNLYSNVNQKLPNKGYKIHIGPKFEQALEVLELVLPILVKHEVSFKILKSETEFKVQYSDQVPPLVAFKFLTIYCANKTQAMQLGNELHKILTNYQGMVIMSDLPFKDSKIVFYRYGDFTTSKKDIDLEAYYSTD